MTIAGSNRLNSQGNLGWLPPLQQIIHVLQFRPEAVIRAPAPQAEIANDGLTNLPPTSMRQGLGLVVLTALIAGLLPFIVNWTIAGRAGSALPLAQLARSPLLRAEQFTEAPLFLQPWVEAVRTIAGIQPWLPGWLAAGLSSLGVWLNQPLYWLNFWLVYGLGILIVGKLFGATTTLQNFYAATSYAYVPLILTILRPIPYLGALAVIVGLVWTFILYVRIVQLVTGLEFGPTVLSVLLPGALAALVALVTAGALVASFLRLGLGA